MGQSSLAAAPDYERSAELAKLVRIIEEATATEDDRQ
jgi:hypothetical protein